jgi:hypothetical protein
MSKLLRAKVRGQGLIEMAVFVFFLMMGVILLYLTLDVECGFGVQVCCDIVNAINSLLGIPPNPGLVSSHSCSAVSALWGQPAGFLFWQ